MLSTVATVIIFLLVQSQSSDVWNDVDDVTESLMEGFGVPGLSLGIIRNGNIERNRGYGLRNVEKSENVTEDTLFCIASITKSFTATLAVKIFHSRNLSLDEPVANILPINKSVYLHGRYRSMHVTMRDMLSHRTCIDPKHFNLNSGYIQDRDEFVWRMRYMPETCAFRSEFLYNDAIYTVAAWVLEQITGQTWETLVKNELLQPLNMTETIMIEDMVRNADQLNFATPYWSNSTLLPTDINLMMRIIPENPCGGIVSTPSDMMKWMTFHMEHGQGLVDSKIMTQLYTAVIPPLDYNMEIEGHTLKEFIYGYGLGFLTGMIHNYKQIMHTGFWNEHTSKMTLVPELNMGIVSLSNWNSVPMHTYLHDFIVAIVTGSQDISTVKERVAKLGQEMKNKKLQDNHEFQNVTDSETTVPFTPEKYVGNYGHLAFGNMTVSYLENTLIVTSGYLTAPLQPTSTENTFKFDVQKSSVASDLPTNPTIPFVFSEALPDGKYAKLEIMGGTMSYHRDLLLSEGPTQPWNETDC